MLTSRTLKPSRIEKASRAKTLDDSATASAPSSRLASDRCIERKRISMPPVVPTKPIGGSRLAYIEIGLA